MNIKFINYSCPKTVLYIVNSYQLSVLVVEICMVAFNRSHAVTFTLIRLFLKSKLFIIINLCT